jgi:hypothetical protein
MSGRQSGLTSAPMSPQAVQTIRGASDLMTVSSGSQSASTNNSGALGGGRKVSTHALRLLSLDHLVGEQHERVRY